LDVYTYKPFAEGVFLASEVPQARIASKDLLTIFPATDAIQLLASGMLELPPQAYSECVRFDCLSRVEQELTYCADIWSSACVAKNELRVYMPLS
jgi:hypothetical protein